MGGDAAPAMDTGRVGPSGSGALASGIVFAPVGGAGAAGATGIPGAGGAEGGSGAEGGAGAEGADGGGGAIAEGAGGGVTGAGGLLTGRSAAPSIGPVAGATTPEGTGAVEPFGATGPESSDWALKLILTVSFFKGTVEVVTEGFGGS